MGKRIFSCGFCAQLTSEIVLCEDCKLENYCSKDCLNKDKLKHNKRCQHLKEIMNGNALSLGKERDNFDRQIIDQFLDQLVEEDQLIEQNKQMVYIFISGIKDQGQESDNTKDLGFFKLDMNNTGDIQRISKFFGTDKRNLFIDYFESRRGKHTCLVAIIKDQQLVFHPIFL